MAKKSAGAPLDSEIFRIQPGASVDLARMPTTVAPLYESRKHYKELAKAQLEGLSAQQGLLYADNRHSLRLIFQAMDAAGKDGTIKDVMSGVNPQGFRVYSFKHPSAEELDHDFLWRSVRCLPERGMIGIFNRSYYEEVLIVRVQPQILRSEKLPPEALAHQDIWQQRYSSINEFEAHLRRNGTRVVKFFLHLSKEEQRKRLLARIDEPDKNWKFDPADIAQRKLWDDYQHAYAECLGATSSADSPWYAVPADDKANARLIVGQVILDSLRGMGLQYPQADAATRRQLQAIRRQLIARKI